jgi:hypothetical protein
MLVKTLGVGIGTYLDFVHILARGDLHSMDEEFLPNPSTNLGRRDPKVFEFRFVVVHHERIETDQLSLIFGDIDVVVRDEFRGDGEILLPVFDPVFGITPVAFRLVSDLSKRGGLG